MKSRELTRWAAQRTIAAVLLVIVTAGAATNQAPAHQYDEAVDRSLEVRPRDIVITKERGTYVGEILDETPFAVQIQVIHEDGDRGAIVTWSKEDVREIRHRNPPEDVYARRLRRMAAADRLRNPELQWQLAQWCREWKLLEQARHHLERVTELDPQRSETYPQLMELYDALPEAQRDEEELDREIAVYHRGIAAGIADPRLMWRAARILIDMGEDLMAIHLLAQLLAQPREALGSLAAPAVNELVALYDRAGRREEARELAQRETANPADGDATNLLLRQAQWLLEGLAAGEAEGQRLLAEKVDEILEADPENGQAYLIRACAKSLCGDLEGARDDFLQANRKGAAGWQLDASFALGFAREGDVEKSETILRRIRNVDDARELHALIRAYNAENRKDDELAWILFREAIGGERVSWQAWIIYLQALRKYLPEQPLADAASTFLESYCEIPAAFASCALLLGDEALSHGDAAAARRWLSYAQMVLPRDVELLIRLGLAELGEGGDLQSARRALEAAHAIDPKPRDLRNALGCLEYRAGNLASARAWFEGVIREYGEEQRESAEPQPTLAYALRGVQQIDGVLGEELWIDDFQREDGPRVLNNWEDDVRFGVSISLSDGRALFDGTQGFQDRALTQLYRRQSGERLSRCRARVELIQGASAVEIALRLEDESGDEGLVFYRRPDGVLAFAINGREGAEIHEPPESDDEGGEEAATGSSVEPQNGSTLDGGSEEDPFAMRRVIWKDDGNAHLIEVRFDGESRGDVALYFDGLRVARDIRLPFGGRGRFRIGISGRAPLGTSYTFAVDDFEIYRRKLEQPDWQRK